MLPESIAPEALYAAVLALGWDAVGHSTLGRPIPGAAFGNGPDVLLVFGGIHGNEPSSVAAALDDVAALAAHPPRDRTVFLVPVLNPDGLLRDVKNSARDVDLNRNFPARNFTTEHRPGYFPGEAPLSEPETRALHALYERLAPRAVVALHAPFACINYDGPAEAWAGAVAQASGWPAAADIGYPTPGSLGSWLGIDAGLPVLTIEFPPGPYAPFRSQAQEALRAALAFPLPSLSPPLPHKP